MSQMFRFKLLAFVNVALFSFLQATEVEETFKKNIPVDGALRLTLENRNGDVEIRSWDKSEIGVTAVKKVRADSEQEAAKLLEMLQISISKTADAIEIITEHPSKRNRDRKNDGFFSWLMGSSGWGTSYSVSYKIFVPENFDLDIASTNGEVTVMNCDGRMLLESTNGKINAHDVSGSVKCNTTNGSINASFLRVSESGEMSFVSTNGSIKLYLPEDTNAEIKARTTNGSINCDMNINERFEESRKRLDVVINDGGILIYLKTTNGSIHINEG